MQMKSTMRRHCAPIRTATSEKTERMSEGVEPLDTTTWKFPQKVLPTQIIWWDDSTAECLPKRNKSLCLYKDVYMNAHDSFFGNKLKTGATLNVHQVHEYMVVWPQRYTFQQSTCELLVHTTAWTDHKITLLSERSQTKKDTWGIDHICVKF